MNMSIKIYKSRDKCLRVAEDSLSLYSSVVIDNTNRNKATRALYIALANKLIIPIRCFYYNTPIELAKCNNVYRASHCPKEGRTLLPGSAFVSYGRDYERPTEDEGFDKLRTVNSVWEGDETQRELWMRYMLEIK
jgi:bifunctional polynucleotide phosphatase/kinase